MGDSDAKKRKAEKKEKKAKKKAKLDAEAAAAAPDVDEKAAKKAKKAAKKAKKEAEAQAAAAAAAAPASEEKKKKSKKEKKEKKEEVAEPETAAAESETTAAAPAAAPVDPQACKCFVGNLSYDIDDDKVREFFKDCGEITDIHWLTDKETGQFYGSGFIEFGNGGADLALKKAGEDLMGRPLKIDMAKPRAPRAGGGGAGGFKKREPKPLSEKPEGCNTVFMGNLSYDIDDNAVYKFFEGIGEIANVRWLTDKETGDFKGCGFVEFTSEDPIDEVVKKNGEDLMGRPVRIDYSAPRKPKAW